MAPKMLFNDPRFRSSTAVPGRNTPSFWSKQFLLKNREELIQLPDQWEASIYAIAAMGEVQVEDQLFLTVDPEPPSHLPLWYLTQLWPQKFSLKLPVLLARKDKLWVRKSETLDNVDVVIVLFAHYSIP